MGTFRACLVWGIWCHSATLGQFPPGGENWLQGAVAMLTKCTSQPQKGCLFYHCGLITCDGTFTWKVEYNCFSTVDTLSFFWIFLTEDLHILRIDEKKANK